MTRVDTADGKTGVSRRIDGVGWALAFVWVGAALLAQVSWGWLLAGLGLIALGAQIVLRMVHEPASGFWITCGLVLLGSGLWDLLRLDWPLAPLIFIVIGVSILLSVLRGRTRA